MRIKRNVMFAMTAAFFLLWGCRQKAKDVNLMITKEINEGWTFRHVGGSRWFPATVPGTVHTDLMDNGVIDDPYYRLNELDVQWIDKVDWEYKTTFFVDGNFLGRDRIQLDCKGLDTYADVYLNGDQILTADNMFREWKADVKKVLKEGENELRILFRSPIAEGLKKYDAGEFVYPGAENDQAERGEVEEGKRVSIYTRKAGYHYGWDWGPRLVTSGIWRPVWLKAWDVASVENIQIVQHEVSEEKASFTAVFEIEAGKNRKAKIAVKNDGTILASASVQLREGIQKYEVDFEIQNPQLWWTNGLGEAHLYNISGEVKIGNRTVSEDTRIGIRTLELVREKDE